jgi:hypothetical protein
MPERVRRGVLARKYHVTTAFSFIGHVAATDSLQRQREGFGYDSQFKPVVRGSGHDPKGNVDADLALKAMIELSTYDKAVILTGDGDYYSLVEHLINQNKLAAGLAPNHAFRSRLWRRSGRGNFRDVEDVQNLVER